MKRIATWNANLDADAQNIIKSGPPSISRPKLKSLIWWLGYIFRAIFDSLFNLLPENARLKKTIQNATFRRKQIDGIPPAPACHA